MSGWFRKCIIVTGGTGGEQPHCIPVCRDVKATKQRDTCCEIWVLIVARSFGFETWCSNARERRNMRRHRVYGDQQNPKRARASLLARYFASPISQSIVTAPGIRPCGC